MVCAAPTPPSGSGCPLTFCSSWWLVRWWLRRGEVSAPFPPSPPPHLPLSSPSPQRPVGDDTLQELAELDAITLAAREELRKLDEAMAQYQ
jgi:hypothetical protein